MKILYIGFGLIASYLEAFVFAALFILPFILIPILLTFLK